MTGSKFVLQKLFSTLKKIIAEVKFTTLHFWEKTATTTKEKEKKNNLYCYKWFIKEPKAVNKLHYFYSNMMIHKTHINKY
jgi:hypothetical protein